MDSPLSPALSDMSDEELDRFFANYVPLSNLPTPPPAKAEYFDVDDFQKLSIESPLTIIPELAGPSTHLSNLVPSNISAHRPCTSTIHSYLVAAGLPLETVAFAACILDGLSMRFASSWRSACSVVLVQEKPPKYYWEALRGDTVSPEIVVLSALSLAVGWLDDTPRTAGYWAHVCSDMFSTAQINATQMCILQDVDYTLHRFTPRMVDEMQRAMTTTMTKHTRADSAVDVKDEGVHNETDRKPKLSLDFQGSALWKFGQTTPEPSP